jgi:hypothetical protein
MHLHIHLGISYRSILGLLVFYRQIVGVIGHISGKFRSIASILVVILGGYVVERETTQREVDSRIQIWR